MSRRTVVSTSELTQALLLADEIVLQTRLFEVPTVRLRPGQSMSGATAGVAVHFVEGADGICCTTDNTIEGLELYASATARAVFNDTSCDSLGTVRLRNLTMTGAVQVLARDFLTSGHLAISNVHILAADTTERSDRPHMYGVSVVQGAFTLWNMQPSNSRLTARIDQLSIGEPERAVRGTGIFVSGSGDDAGGMVAIEVLRAGPVFANGCIPLGTVDQISGGVFVLYGVQADLVENTAPVVTYGNNDMALDNWGIVGQWIVNDSIRTYGASAIGFVNFGVLDDLQVRSAIETSGVGARGFNVYAGTVRRAEFERIVTRGDGAVGIQISQPVGSLMVSSGVETFGATGPSLVKGLIKQLSPFAVSVQPGAVVEELRIRGGLRTHGRGIPPLEQNGSVHSLVVEGGMANIPAPLAGAQ